MSKMYLVVTVANGLLQFRSEKMLTSVITALESMIGGSVVVMREHPDRIRQRRGTEREVICQTSEIAEVAWQNRAYIPCFCGLTELFPPGDPRAEATPKLLASDFTPGDVIKIFTTR